MAVHRKIGSSLTEGHSARDLTQAAPSQKKKKGSSLAFRTRQSREGEEEEREGKRREIENRRERERRRERVRGIGRAGESEKVIEWWRRGGSQEC